MDATKEIKISKDKDPKDPKNYTTGALLDHILYTMCHYYTYEKIYNHRLYENVTFYGLLQDYDIVLESLLKIKEYQNIRHHPVCEEFEDRIFSSKDS